MGINTFVYNRYIFISKYIAKAAFPGAFFVIMKGGRIEKMILSENERAHPKEK